MMACNCLVCGRPLPMGISEESAQEAEGLWGVRPTGDEDRRFAPICTGCRDRLCVCPKCFARWISATGPCPKCGHADVRRGLACMAFDKERGVIQPDGEIDFTKDQP